LTNLQRFAYWTPARFLPTFNPVSTLRLFSAFVVEKTIQKLVSIASWIFPWTLRTPPAKRNGVNLGALAWGCDWHQWDVIQGNFHHEWQQSQRQKNEEQHCVSSIPTVIIWYLNRIYILIDGLKGIAHDRALFCDYDMPDLVQRICLVRRKRTIKAFIIPILWTVYSVLWAYCIRSRPKKCPGNLLVFVFLSSKLQEATVLSLHGSGEAGSIGQLSNMGNIHICEEKMTRYYSGVGEGELWYSLCRPSILMWIFKAL
jgi:hypothetical protein